jgi:hypothetical protein
MGELWFKTSPCNRDQRKWTGVVAQTVEHLRQSSNHSLTERERERERERNFPRQLFLILLSCLESQNQEGDWLPACQGRHYQSTTELLPIEESSCRSALGAEPEDPCLPEARGLSTVNHRH